MNNHRLLIAGGIIFGILILIGLVVSLQPFLPHDSSATLEDSTNTDVSLTSDTQEGIPVHPSCTNCIWQEDNNQEMVLPVGSSITIELSQKLYPEANILVISNPDGIFTVSPKGKVTTKGDWIKTFTAIEAGVADVIVKSASASVSDFHISVVVQ